MPRKRLKRLRHSLSSQAGSKVDFIYLLCPRDCKRGWVEFSKAQIRCQLKLKYAASRGTGTSKNVPFTCLKLLHCTPSHLFLFIQVGSYASLPATVTSKVVSWLWGTYSKLKCSISISFCLKVKQHLLHRREKHDHSENFQNQNLMSCEFWNKTDIMLDMIVCHC